MMTLFRHLFHIQKKRFLLTTTNLFVSFIWIGPGVNLASNTLSTGSTCNSPEQISSYKNWILLILFHKFKKAFYAVSFSKKRLISLVLYLEWLISHQDRLPRSSCFFFTLDGVHKGRHTWGENSMELVPAIQPVLLKFDQNIRKF